MIEVVALITARGGSKAIPHKNIAMLAGKPLIAWSIEAALKSRCLKRVMVSTDDKEIARVAKAYGAEVPFMRPSELAMDDSSHISVVEHAIRWLKNNESFSPQYLMLLQPTSPMRESKDIDASAELAEKMSAEAVISVCEATRHPYKTYCLNEDDTLSPFIKNTKIPYLRRQGLPKVYWENGAIYLNRCDSLFKTKTFFPPGAYPYIMPEERSLDVDTQWDLRIADLLLGDKRNEMHNRRKRK